MKKLSVLFLISVGLASQALAQTPADTSKFVKIKDGLIVGKGFPSPYPAGYAMYVSTGILTERVRIAAKNTTNWADYVFEPDYRLPKLRDVEAYVRTNKHLPDVPSAQTVAREGVDLLDTQVLLLKKVEELTLYVIRQEKEINRLKRLVARSKTAPRK